jgi:fucose 4-O-acetylase-like acetyltransferase
MNKEGAIDERVLWIDIARGIGIILVVFGHVLIGFSAQHPPEFSGRLAATEYAIYTFHMPLFFVLAGLNVERSLAKGRARFLENKLWTIGYPYILWSLIQGGIQVLLPQMINTPHGAMSLLTILWRPIGQFWFLYVLFVCHLIAWLFKANRWILSLLAVASILSFSWLTNGLFGPIAHMLPFYILGIFLSDNLLKWKPNATVAAVFALVSFGFFLLCAHFGAVFSRLQPYALPSLPAALAGICLVILISHFLVRTSAHLSAWFLRLGQASLTIYVLHVLAYAPVRVVLTRLGVTSLIPHLALETAAGVLVPFGVHVLLERLQLLSAAGLGPRKKKPSRPPLQQFGRHV